MKTICLIILLWSIVLTGCTSIKVAQDYDPVTDFTSLEKFAWASVTQAPTGDLRIDSPLRDSRIRTAVARQLEAKGFRQVARVPQFNIQYQYRLQRSLSSYGPSFGFGIGTGHHGRYGGIGLGSGDSIYEYERGVLIIDFIDPASGALLWRGTGSHIYTDHTDPNKAIRETHVLVEKILNQFPPQP